MRIVIEPWRDRAHPIDVTEPLVETIARELARRCGGNAVLNRLEAAAQLERILDGSWRPRLRERALAVIEGRALDVAEPPAIPTQTSQPRDRTDDFMAKAGSDSEARADRWTRRGHASAARSGDDNERIGEEEHDVDACRNETCSDRGLR